MKMHLPLALAAAWVALAASPSRAELVYGVTLIDNQLISIDSTTGAGTLVGPLSAPINPFGLASVNNQLFTFDSADELIQRINPATGGIAQSYNIGIGPVLGQGGLAFQSGTIGYLTTALVADPTSPNYLSAANNLYMFNLATGTTTLIAQTADTLESIAFGPDGRLYGLGKLDGNLYRVDPATGGTTLIGNVGVPIGSPVGAITFDPSGTLLATLDDALYTLNINTGVATAVVPGGPMTGFFSISGLAVTNSASVPEPASAAMLGLGIVGLVAVARRRARIAA